jgi:hypothetical protein
VDPSWKSKFGASGGDDVSSVSSVDDEFETSVLVSEDLEAGLSMEQIRQAEDELVSPSSNSTKVCNQLKEGSTAKNNHQNRAVHGEARYLHLTNHLCEP